MEGNQVFTFDGDGTFVRYTDVEGFPRTKERKARDVATQGGMVELVEEFFRNNFRDVTKRRTVEWGKLSKDDAGNSSIRYKYHATIRGTETKVMNQIFTFDGSGNFVSVKDVEEQKSSG